jgi:hypothetical protein
VKGWKKIYQWCNTWKDNNNYQLLCTQCQCTQFHQTCTKGFKSSYKVNTVVVGEFNTPLSPVDRSSKQNQILRELRLRIHTWQLLTILPFLFQRNEHKYLTYKIKYTKFWKLYTSMQWPILCNRYYHFLNQNLWNIITLQSAAILL